MITCPRCNGQCAPSDDVCTDWKSRALAAEAELETVKRELKQSQMWEHFWKMRCARLSTKDGAESVLTHFKGV